VIPTLPFGKTGHSSSRVIFGAAALMRVTQPDADRVLETLLEAGINHIDVAASYGDAELRVGAWMAEHRRDFFLATKTGERGYEAAREQIRKSLERLRVSQLDLIQLHNLVKEEEWQQALGDDGALRAAVEARDEGLVRFVGVTGHGTRVADMHLRSLERFDFDSVLLPHNFSMMAQPDYAASFERLLEVCRERRVPVQTIKAIAQRRWAEGETPTTTTWYRAFEEPEDIERAVHWTLARPEVFLNTASDPTLLAHTLRAAQRFFDAAVEAPSAAAMQAAEVRVGAEALFVHGYRPNAEA
jgi:aryl-alcohol dehydrogenase-like predicted oxidoreductase